MSPKVINTKTRSSLFIKDFISILKFTHLLLSINMILLSELDSSSESEKTMTPNLDDLVKIANMKMPFGRFKGRALIDLPEPYIVWFHKEGFPGGELGRLLAQVYEIKVNGLEHLFEPLKEIER